MAFKELSVHIPFSFKLFS